MMACLVMGRNIRQVRTAADVGAATELNVEPVEIVPTVSPEHDGGPQPRYKEEVALRQLAEVSTGDGTRNEAMPRLPSNSSVILPSVPETSTSECLTKSVRLLTCSHAMSLPEISSSTNLPSRAK